MDVNIHVLWSSWLNASMYYGVATISRLLKIIRLLGRVPSLLLGSCAKETYNFKEPTNRSHPIMHPCTFPFAAEDRYIFVRRLMPYIARPGLREFVAEHDTARWWTFTNKDRTVEGAIGQFVSQFVGRFVGVPCDSFIRETWLIDTWDMTHPYVRHDSFQSCVRHDAFVCELCLIRIRVHGISISQLMSVPWLMCRVVSWWLWHDRH